FPESVEGLEVGAPVKVRGVMAGRVSKIAFAPDQRTVEVRTELDATTLKSMGVQRTITPDIRIQLASHGLVGTKYLSIDIFDPKTHPPPILTFAPPENYIPVTPSLEKSLEDSLSKALDRLAQIMDTVVRERLIENVAQAVTRADEMLAEI